MDERCHYAAYAAHFHAVDMEPCENPAMFTTTMSAVLLLHVGASPGPEPVGVQVCYTHDLLLSTAPGWQRSLRLRSKPGPAATSPAAGS